MMVRINNQSCITSATLHRYINKIMISMLFIALYLWNRFFLFLAFGISLFPSFALNIAIKRLWLFQKYGIISLIPDVQVLRYHNHQVIFQSDLIIWCIKCIWCIRLTTADVDTNFCDSYFMYLTILHFWIEAHSFACKTVAGVVEPGIKWR